MGHQEGNFSLTVSHHPHRVKVKRFGLERLTRCEAKGVGKASHLRFLNHSNHTSPGRESPASACTLSKKAAWSGSAPGNRFLLGPAVPRVSHQNSFSQLSLQGHWCLSVWMARTPSCLTFPRPQERLLLCGTQTQEGWPAKKQSSRTGYREGAVCPCARVNHQASHRKPRPAPDRHLRGTYSRL